MSKPAHCRPRAFALLAQQLPHLETDQGLVYGAVAIAMHEMPDADPPAVDKSLEQLAQRIASRLRSNSPQAILAHAHDVLFEEEGFHGNQQDFYNPDNSYLPAVLDGKKGIPISLTLIYKSVLGRLGLRVRGIQAPVRFLAEVEMGPDQSMLVDCFTGGQAMSREEAFALIERLTGANLPRLDELLAPASHRQWLIRMLSNLQNIFAYSQSQQDVLAMLEMRALLESAGK